MDTNQQPKAAYLAQELKAGEWSPNILQNEVALRQCAAEELLRQHAEIETLRAGYDAAECSDRKVVKLDARIKELEAQLDAEGAVGMEPLRKTNAAARGTPAADAPTTAAALSRASDLLSSTIGILMGQRAKIAYTDNSPVAALVNEAVEFLRPWPEQLPSSAGAPVVLPEPVAYSLGLAKYAHSSNLIAANEFTPDTEHADEWENLYTEQQVRALLATATGLPAQAARTWRGGNMTVADLVNNLLMMDQSLPIYGAQTIEHPQGRRRVIAIHPTVSRERVKDSRWIGEGNELNAAIIWTRAEQPAAPQALDARKFLRKEDLERLHRFIETTEDDESYDIGKDEVKRLAEIGVVCNHGFGRYSVTAFGYWAHESDWEQCPNLPLKTNSDRDAEQRAAIAAAKGE